MTAVRRHQDCFLLKFSSCPRLWAFSTRFLACLSYESGRKGCPVPSESLWHPN